jgi:hypothetical protein
MNRKIVGGLAAVALVAVGAAGAVGVMSVTPAQAQGYGAYGCPGMGMMGPGMMGQGMMGQGMMGPGMMGMMGPGMMGQQANLNLTTNDVKGYLERWVAMSGNPRIKVGPVTERNDNTISADIVTTERDALVQRFSVDRSTGIYRVVQ